MIPKLFRKNSLLALSLALFAAFAFPFFRGATPEEYPVGDIEREQIINRPRALPTREVRAFFNRPGEVRPNREIPRDEIPINSTGEYHSSVTDVSGTDRSHSNLEKAEVSDKSTAIDSNGRSHPVDPYADLRQRADQIDSDTNLDSSTYFEQVGIAGVADLPATR